MSAADRLAILSQANAADLCAQTDSTLTALVDIMNRETTLLRAGQMREAGTLSAEKTQLAQDYVMLARAVQREGPRLKIEAPAQLKDLQSRHESFATQMAENLRVLATAKTVTETLLSDVSKTVNASNKPKTYAQNGAMPQNEGASLSGISINRAL